MGTSAISAPLFPPPCTTAPSSPPASEVESCSSVQTRALYVWKPQNGQHVSPAQLVAYAQTNHMNTLYYEVRYTDGNPGQWEKEMRQARELILAAHQVGIRVYALFGDKWWAYRANQRLPISYVRALIAYNQNHPRAMFDGIHLDIEFWGIDQFHEGQDQNIANQYLTFLQLVQTELEKPTKQLQTPKMALAVDLLPSFDQWKADPAKGTPCEGFFCNNKKKPLYEHVIDIADEVTLMAYQDDPARIIEATRTEIEYAKRQGKPITIALETQPPNRTFGVTPEITFYEEGRMTLSSALAQVTQAFQGDLISPSLPPPTTVAIEPKTVTPPVIPLLTGSRSTIAVGQAAPTTGKPPAESSPPPQGGLAGFALHQYPIQFRK